MKGTFLECGALILGMVFLVCAPLHLIGSGEAHASHGGHHHHVATYDAMLSHVHDMSEVTFGKELLSFALLALALCVYVLSYVPVIKTYRTSRSRILRPPELLRWLTLHLNSPPRQTA